MKKRTRRLLSLMLSLILVIGLIPNVARAEGTLLPAPVITVDENGVATWPAIELAVRYGYSFSNGVAGWFFTNECDIPATLALNGAESGTYTLTIWAADYEKNQISEKASVEYSYTKDHVHEWATDWTYNDIDHWHACLNTPCSLSFVECEGYGPHVFSAEGVCICGKEGEPASTYKVTVDGGNADKTEYAPGETVTITAYAPGTNQKFSGWTSTDDVTFDNATATTTTFVMPPKNVSVKANFDQLSVFHVTVVGGTANKEGAGENKYKAEKGDTITITAYDAPDGKKFVGWQVTVNDMFVDVDLADATAKETTFEMPEGNVRVDAVFEDLPATYHVTVEGGTADKYEAEEGEAITITANAPGSNQKFVGWTVVNGDGFIAVELTNASAAETTFTMPNGNVMVKANFEEIESYHVTVVGGTANKEGAGENKYKAEPGETIKITAYAPGSNQKFVGWKVTVNDMFVTVELADASAAETTFTMPNGNVRVDAVFEDVIPSTYKVQVVGGTADKTEYAPGETVTITAYEPASDKQFAKWTTEDGVTFADATKTTTTFTMPAKDVRVDATYEDKIPEKYKVQVVGGTADKTEYAPGETVTITAYEPASDKQFAKWTTEDGVTFADATKATTTFVMPAKDVRVDATYEDEVPSTYKVTVVGGNADKTEYAPGETVTITAYPPASDMQFAKWTTEDGVTFADATKSTTTFVMPAKDVRVDATYEDEVPSDDLDDVPQTGDPMDVVLWGTLAMVSALAVAVLTVFKKKRIF